MVKIILHKLYIATSFFLMVLGVYFGYLHYVLFKDDIQKLKDPLIQYSFVDDKKAFAVSGGADIEIKEVTWTMPSVVSPIPLRINAHPRMLTIEDLKTQLYFDFSHMLAGLPAIDPKSFVECSILGDTHSLGIPLVAEVTFRERGEESLRTISSLVYAEWLTSDSPFIEVYEEDASPNEKENFMKQAFKELSKRFAIAKEVLAAHTFSGLDNCKHS